MSIMFGNNTGSALAGNASAEMNALLDIKLWKSLNQEARKWSKFFTIQKGLPSGKSNEIEFKKWLTMSELYFNSTNQNALIAGNTIDPATNAGDGTIIMPNKNEYTNFILAEGSSGTSHSDMKIITKKYNTILFGDWIEYSEESLQFSDMLDLEEITYQMGEMAGLIVGGYYRDSLLAGSGHYYDLSANTMADSAFGDSLKRLSIIMRLSGAKPVNRIIGTHPNQNTVAVNSRYIAVIPTASTISLESNPDFVEIKNYPAQFTLLENEVGMLKDIRFVSDSTALYTPTGVAGEYECEVPVMGNDHSARIKTRQGDIQMVLHQIGSSGVSDKLNRIGSVGWKYRTGSFAMYPERYAVIKIKFNF